ncbi:MAG: PepSY domain-containing protein [Candidatus Pacearchaeota archaeon]
MKTKAIAILSLLLCLMFASFVFPMQEDSENSAVEVNGSNCQNLYYFDNENKNCDQKEFCGMYIYQGLEVFNNKVQCEHKLNNSKPECYIDEDCPGLCPACLDCSSCKPQKCANKTCKTKENCPNGTWQENESCIYNFSNGRKGEIKVMPETASSKAIERLGQLGFTIELKEVGSKNETRIAYELIGEKEGKVLGLFNAHGKVKAYVDAKTGEIIKIKKPWWSFLSTNI